MLAVLLDAHLLAARLLAGPPGRLTWPAAGSRRCSSRPLRHAADLIFVTAVGRLLANIVIVLCSIAPLPAHRGSGRLGVYAGRPALGRRCTSSFSVALPHALARHAGERDHRLVRAPLHALRVVMLPVTKLMHMVDELVLPAAGPTDPSPSPSKIEQEILSAVEEGEKEGVVDEQERQMIESVIEFRDTQAGQIMTARPEIVAPRARRDARRGEADASRSPATRASRSTTARSTTSSASSTPATCSSYLGEPPEQFDIRIGDAPGVLSSPRPSRCATCCTTSASRRSTSPSSSTSTAAPPGW